MTAFSQVLADRKREIDEVDVAELRELLGTTDVVLIDCRQRDEFAQGSIEGAHCIPRGLLEHALPRVAARHETLVIYCAGGTRSALAASAAQALGYDKVSSLAGGFGQWKQSGAPFCQVSPPPFPEDLEPEGLADAPVITSAELAEALESEERPVLIDVREDEETEQGYIPGSSTEPRGFLEMRIEGLVPNRRSDLVIVSSRGARAELARRDLARLGYESIRVLDGGIQAWTNGGHPLEVPRRLSPHDRLRYSRHLLVEEVGEAGQLRLLRSRVLLMGAGGLGSPAAYYLAAAGVGTLGIIDSDVVDRSNLQRQILHTDDRVGTPKVVSAKQTLSALNPDIAIETWEARLTSDNVLDVLDGFDLVIDGGDNFPTRYLLNDACVHLGIPCVHGSVYRFEGQVTVFAPGEGPCYRCLYPHPPPPEMAPNCAEAGVLGVLPGIIGLLQASEAIKVLLGIGDTLVGRLVHFDALSFHFRELKLRRDPGCSVCGDGAEFTGFVDYEDFCSV